MLEGLLFRAVGKFDGQVQSYAARRFESLLTRLLVLAVTGWGSESFKRFGNAEIDCTARLYDWCEQLINEDRAAWPSMRVQYDGALLTPAMRAGTEDPKKSPRPDMFVYVGTIAVHVEAKRLARGDRLPHLYVDQGMKRFIKGVYAWRHDHRGVMVSYHMVDAPKDAILLVNQAIENDPHLGSNHNLHFERQLSQNIEVYKSAHQLHFDLLHFTFDMR